MHQSTGRKIGMATCLVISILIIVPVSILLLKKSQSVSHQRSLEKSSDAVRQTPSSVSYHHLISDKKWVIADYHSVWITENEGANWKNIYQSVPDHEYEHSIKCLSIINDLSLILIDKDKLMKTNDGGATWLEISRLKIGVKTCFFIDELRGWYAGDLSGTIYHTNNGGYSWQPQMTNMPAGKNEIQENWEFNDILFLNEDDGWAVGNGVIIWTDDGGKNWKRAGSDNLNYLRVSFLDRLIGWAVAKHDSSFAKTTDGGRHWNLYEGPPSFGDWTPNFFFLSENHGYASLNHPYETFDGGKTWRRIGEAEQYGYGYEYISRTGDNTLIFFGINQGESISITSKDEGVSWHGNGMSIQNDYLVSNKKLIERYNPFRKSLEETLQSVVKKVEATYPPIAGAARAEGQVIVEILIDENGQVIHAYGLSGHPLLIESAVQAARQWQFKPEVRSGVAVKVNGVIEFRFNAPQG